MEKSQVQSWTTACRYRERWQDEHVYTGPIEILSLNLTAACSIGDVCNNIREIRILSRLSARRFVGVK